MFRVQESHEAAIVLRNALAAHTTGRLWTNRHPGSDHFHLELDQDTAADLLAAITGTPTEHHGGTMTDTTATPGHAGLTDHLNELRERHLTNDDGEPAVVCLIDGYPSPMTCHCGHGHNRHSGSAIVRCMSYVGQPDCACTRFIPDAASVSALWLAYTELLARLDVEKITELVPDVRTSKHVRDWPADEQAVWDAHDKTDGVHDALDASDTYRRRKVAVAILAAVVGLS